MTMGVNNADDLTFKIKFAGDGVAKLREIVKDKLKVFMGDYTDDTLVEYVIVLLKNGRRKVEARNELNVFLGDDSDSFVSWLWDHLGSNLDSYVQPRESLPKAAAKKKSMARGQDGKIDSNRLESELEREKPNKLSKSSYGRESKSLVRNAGKYPPLRSVVITANFNIEEDFNQNIDHTKRSPPPRPKFSGKKRRLDERQQREEVSKTAIDASRRLLQFAVRDAVGAPRSSSLGTEPSLKRRRSMVSTSTVGDSLHVNSSLRIRSVSRVPNGTMAVAIKAVAEAAKDVAKVKSLGNVFDRLGRPMDELETTDDIGEFREILLKAGGDRDFDYVQEQTESTYLPQRHYREHYTRNKTLLKSDTGITSDLVSNSGVHGGGHNLGHGTVDISDSGVSCESHINYFLTSQHSIARKTNGRTLKPRNDQVMREGADTTVQKCVQGSEESADKSGFMLMKGNNKSVSVGNGNAIPAISVLKETPKAHLSTTGLYSTNRVAEDADSRTIFVSNVHFASTKDSLSRHFNKFGNVLKVVILTDATTGQPKGSAYVEFMQKDAAEHALSLEGTSFMSRILKVAMKSAALQDATPAMTWSRVSRGSMFAAPRCAGLPIPRGIPGMYRARLPIKAGARSFQWKRDAQTTPTEATGVSNNSVPSPIAPRSLTYVRAYTKLD